MKIAAVTTLLPNTHYAQYLCRALESLAPGSLTVYADRNPRNKAVAGCGKVEMTWPNSPAYVSSIREAVKANPPDVVHLQHEFNMYGGPLTAVLFPFLLGKLRRLGARIVVTVHAVVEPELMDRRFMSMFGKGMRRCPPFLMRLLFRWLYARIARNADRVIVHTRRMKDILINRYGASAERLVVIPHGVPASQSFNGAKENYALFFGYIARRKGLRNVLAGYRRHMTEHPKSGLMLVLAGGTIAGQEYAREEIEQWIAERHLTERVRLTGFVDAGKPIDDLFGKAKCVLIPAEISIAASGPLAQAMRYGKCIVASRIGNLAEEIEHGKDGFLVDNDRWEEAFAFIDAPAHQEDMERMEERIRAKAEARSWPKIAERHLDLYRSLST